jgi:hypothetical protein
MQSSGSAKLRYCKNDRKTGGYCVSAAEWLPDEPFDYDWVQLSPIVGCNQLMCSSCGAKLRSVVGVELPPELTAKDVYELMGAHDLSRFTASPSCRAYACHCFRTNVTTFFRVRSENDMDEGTPWRCDGHPTVSLPLVLEGIEIDEQTDWQDLARRSFAGELGVSLHPNVDRQRGFWLQRLYRLLEKQPVAAKISNAAADRAIDPNPRVRLGAIVFFRLGWNEPGAERMAPALRDHPELFADVLVDGYPVTLERQMLDMLDYRITNKVADPVAIELMRAALYRRFEPIGIQQSLFSMAQADQKWLLEHADEIVAARPEAWDHMQHALKSAGAPKRALADLQQRVNARRASG